VYRYVRNIGLNKFMGTVEKATLLPHPTKPNETSVLKQVDAYVVRYLAACRPWPFT
jgi:hypothetical protein